MRWMALFKNKALRRPQAARRRTVEVGVEVHVVA